MERIFAQNNSNVALEIFFACFWQFQLFTQSDNSAKSIAFAWWSVLTILEMLSFFQY